ncbi:polysaccharide pyruvyl transferase family protein [Komagataeibacter melaceti]|uniref:Polysaccharide pyruvyl transferase family protein n=1 Tax=Komagataeibacter melaceti TaxID=2766577 RepID=A0A371YW16_9PROT|nr:polysaccharide pyruvyl transferase family protein [Komagataeibacter melaceti]RFD18403.1 polysaccharide pyruvyl transferase family protein [Komagataeibacter melaceti]
MTEIDVDMKMLFSTLCDMEVENHKFSHLLKKLTLSQFLKFIISSSESIENKNKLWNLAPSRDDVQVIYRILLQRDVESEDAMLSALNAPTVADLVRIVASSKESQVRAAQEVLMSSQHQQTSMAKKNKKHGDIMLFGAYGNGNLGDRELATPIYDMLVDSGIDNDRISATSWEHISDFSFPGLIRDQKSIVDFDLIKNLGVLIIGGGGIFGVNHFPLHDIRWVNHLVETKTPCVIWAAGASFKHLQEERFRAAYTKLIEHAVIVTGRDDESIAAFREFRSDCAFAMDPLLFKVLARQSSSTPPILNTRRVDVILRSPLSASDQYFISEFRNIYLESDRNNFRVFFLQPDVGEEKRLIDTFPGAICVRSISELESLLRGSRLCISMRLHGCIAALGAKVPIVGLCQTKILEMMKILKIENNFFEDSRPLIHSLKNHEFHFRDLSVDKELMARAIHANERLVEVVKHYIT